MADGVQLPTGRTLFTNLVGAPLVGGKVYYYIPTTLTPKDTYQDEGLTILNTNPIILDSAGTAVMWGSGLYRQIVKDPLGNELSDEVVGLIASGGSGVDNSWVTIPVDHTGTTDLGAVSSANILLDNTGDHSIINMGTASSGTFKTLGFTSSRATFIFFDNDVICGFNSSVYNGSPTQYFDNAGDQNGIPCLPGDFAVFTSLGPLGSGGKTRWALVSYTPNYLFSWGLIKNPGGNSLIPPNNFFAIGPRGPGTYPWFNGLGIEYQTGTTKVVTPTIEVRGGGDSGGKLFFEVASSGSGGGAIYNASGEIRPLQVADVPYGATKVTFWPFVDDPTNPGHVNHVQAGLGGYWPYGPGVCFEGNSSVIYNMSTEAPTINGTGGTLVFSITKKGTVTDFQRAWFDDIGNFVVAGPAVLEGGFGVTGAWPFSTPYPTEPQKWFTPSGDANWLDTQGWGNLSIIATDITNSDCRYNAALAIRKYGNHGEGEDIGYDPTGDGTINRYSVTGSVRTAVETLDPVKKIFTYPVQPAFQVQFSADVSSVTGDGTNYTVLWPVEIFDRGANLTSSVFTAPVDGVYDFSACITFGNYAAAARTGAQIQLVMTGRTFTRSFGAPVADASGNITVALDTVCSMNAGDTAIVKVLVTGASKTVSVVWGGNTLTPSSWFSGNLIG